MNKNIPEAVALQFLLDAGVDEALSDAPIDRFAQDNAPVSATAPVAPKAAKPAAEIVSSHVPGNTTPLLGASEARKQAAKLAAAAQTLDELKEAILSFEGIELQKTAMNMVFADGNPAADLMIIGEAPGTDDDRQGMPFVGVSGQLLDKILACIGRCRAEDDPQKSFYISNVLNYRPPGNRSPAPAEIEVSLPFIERHIQLVQPKVLLFSGGVAAKALLQSANSISKLRKSWHVYQTNTPELAENKTEIPSLATFHPSYLLRTPAQKRAAWADMLMLQEKLDKL